MSNKERVQAKLYKRRQLDSEVVTLLIDDPNCLEGDSQRDEAYQVAIDYFVLKKKESQTTVEEKPARSDAVMLAVLTECHADADNNGKQEYARKIARFLLETTTKWLKPIPEETKEIAFDIVIQYFESQMYS